MFTSVINSCLSCINSAYYIFCLNLFTFTLHLISIWYKLSWSKCYTFKEHYWLEYSLSFTCMYLLKFNFFLLSQFTFRLHFKKMWKECSLCHNVVSLSSVFIVIKSQQHDSIIIFNTFPRWWICEVFSCLCLGWDCKNEFPFLQGKYLHMWLLGSSINVEFHKKFIYYC